MSSEREGGGTRRDPEIAIVGAGPAGLSAAAVAAEAGARVAVYDENDRPGGQLFKQIHKFFGSEDHYAGVRGLEIGERLIQRVLDAGAELCLNTAVFGVYEELTLGLYTEGRQARFIRPQRVIIAVGATERALVFPGWTLPGVMGAGAAQTLMNIHRVLPGRRVLMVGSGNVGLIVSYQLMQAGAEVVGVVESGPAVGGYGVHAAKLARQGVPIYLGHSVVEAVGDGAVEGVTIGGLDREGRLDPDTHREMEVDLICLAVGLTPQIELAQMAGCELDWQESWGGHVVKCNEEMVTTVPKVYVAGDATGVEEASTAMEEGILAGVACAQSLGCIGVADAARLRRQSRERLGELRRGAFGRDGS